TFATERDIAPERWLYRWLRVDPRSAQTWQSYARSVLAFSVVGLVLLYLIQRLQAFLPFAGGHKGVEPFLAFNTAASFATNTNWQNYSPEQTLGHSVQMFGLTVQNFVSGATGLAVAIALVRGFAYVKRGTIGNFWVDATRAIFRILLPLAVVSALVLLAGGVIQNLVGHTDVTTIAGGTQSIPGGPVASQEAIKLLGTNGGGFFNANSAHPF
ncbi:potassium-transporting ATPase subunit KdpA, partial [Timonella senegalensis]